jgi:hypothetical protein
MTTVLKPKRSEVAASIPTTGQLEVGEIALNIADGKFFTKTSGNIVKEVGGAGAITLQGVTNNGAVSTNDIVLNGADLVFEGNIENAFETTLTVAEPTVDRTITLPNVDGTIITTGNLSSITSLGAQTTSLNLAQNVNIIFEGASDDAYETTLTVADPTADRTITLPNQNGTIAMVDDALALSIVFGG